ncbi:uncharacterized protein LOC129729256 [Wyeomyia smithii]|uniref:uncharacterized protein LOC129729256 n=1 Tax=Wyeomyia smithii TaxID=174621 RepID=UPI002467B5C0|nr:uncharacterized protein LOC129729256 [Wyeomyia smithii]
MFPRNAVSFAILVLVIRVEQVWVCSEISIFTSRTLNTILLFKSYNIELESFLPDPQSDPTLVNYGTVRLFKKSRISLEITGYFFMLRNLGRQNEVLLEFGMLRPAEQFVPLNRIRQELCEFYNTDYPIVQVVREKSNLPPKGTCPFPKGKYHLYNYEVSFSHLPPMLAPGRFYTRLVVLQDGQYASGAMTKGVVSL